MSLKTYKIISIIAAAIVAIAGVVTFIFAIIGLANSKAFDPTVVVRFLYGVLLCLVGSIVLVVSLIKDGKELNLVKIGICGICIGAGAFCFLQNAGTVLANIIGLAVPIVVAGFGIALVIKSFFAAAHKVGLKVYLPIFLIGAICAAVGITFAIIPQTYYVTWMILGLAMLGYSIYDIVRVAKLKEVE